MSITDDKTPWTNGYAEQSKRIKELEDELHEATQGLKEAWYIFDHINTDRADEWQNKYAWVFGFDKNN